MITKILNDLVESYMESQFVNYGIDIGFYMARKELLGGGDVGFYNQGTCTPKYITHKGFTLSLPNPVVADSNGKFEEIDGEGSYTIIIRNKNGESLLMADIRAKKDSE